MSELNPKTPILSIRQPYASFIIFPMSKGGAFLPDYQKDVENRSWKAPDWLIGNQLYIHAGKQFYDGFSKKTMDYHFDNQNAKAMGAVIGIVTLVDCIRDSDSRWAVDDSWHWVLSNPEPLSEPVPIKGQLGLFYATTN